MLAVSSNPLERLQGLTAADVMSRNVTVIPDGASMEEAAGILTAAAASGAPVVDATGRALAS